MSNTQNVIAVITTAATTAAVYKVTAKDNAELVAHFVGYTVGGDLSTLGIVARPLNPEGLKLLNALMDTTMGELLNAKQAKEAGIAVLNQDAVEIERVSDEFTLSTPLEARKYERTDLESGEVESVDKGERTLH